ncbi:hypothetical protein DFH09DRAFT_1104019 [Mycena vulgaris]|nr:hypothetical protein DFH09DRAFT_1104019 [Mycena vulgaris]
MTSASTHADKNSLGDDLMALPPKLDLDFLGEAPQMDVDSRVNTKNVLDWSCNSDTETPGSVVNVVPTTRSEELEPAMGVLPAVRTAVAGSEHNVVALGGEPAKEPGYLTVIKTEIEKLRIALGISQALEARARDEAEKAAERACKSEVNTAALREQIEWYKSRQRGSDDAAEDRAKYVKELQYDLGEAQDKIEDLKKEVQYLHAQQVEPEHKCARWVGKEREIVEPAQDAMDVETYAAEPASSAEQSLAPATVQISEEKSSSRTYASIAERINAEGFPGGVITLEMKQQAAAEFAQRYPPLLKRWPGHLDRPKPMFESIGYEAPPHQSPADLEGVDKRGMPLTPVAWEFQFLSSNEQHVWVYVFHVFVLWAYGHSISEAMRSSAHKHVIANYTMPDWFADTLAVMGRQQQTNLQRLAMCRNRSQSDLEFDVQGLAEFLQYTEQSIRGCRFVDNAWTLRLRSVRRTMLLEVLNVERLRKKEFAPAQEHVARIHFEKMLITLLAATITTEELVAEMATNGVTIELVNDAWLFARDWVKEVAESSPLPTGWTAAEANTLLARLNGVPDPRGFDDVNALWPQHPSLPWSSKAEQILQYEVSDWHSPYIAGMKRMANLQIQVIIDCGGTCRPPHHPHNPEHLALNNPWTTRSKESTNPLACSHPLANTACAARQLSGPQLSPEAPPSLLTCMAPTMVVKRVHAPAISMPVASMLQVSESSVSDSVMELDIQTGADPDTGEDHTMLQYDEGPREDGPVLM